MRDGGAEARKRAILRAAAKDLAQDDAAEPQPPPERAPAASTSFTPVAKSPEALPAAFDAEESNLRHAHSVCADVPGEAQRPEPLSNSEAMQGDGGEAGEPSNGGEQPPTAKVDPVQEQPASHDRQEVESEMAAEIADPEVQPEPVEPDPAVAHTVANSLAESAPEVPPEDFSPSGEEPEVVPVGAFAVPEASGMEELALAAKKRAKKKKASKQPVTLKPKSFA